MTVESTKRKQIVNGTGGLGPYPFTDIQLFNADQDMQVFVELNDGTLTSQFTIDIDYTLSYDSETISGDVTFISRNVQLNEKVVMVRSTPLTQGVKLAKTGTIDSTNYEDMVDKVTIQQGDQQEDLDRSIKIGVNQVGAVNANLPALTTAGSAIVINSTLDGFGYSTTNVNEIDEAVAAASASAAAALASETNASTSASNASTSESNAETSATEAAASAASIITGSELGSIIPFIIDTLPQGYLECNGATVQATTYPELVEYLNPGQPSAVLPDLRGEFVRGYDNGKGIDTGRVLGTSQDDSFESHDHFIANTETSGTAITDTTHVTKSGSIQGPGDDEYSLAGTSTEPTLGLTSSTGDIETRPRNIALKYGIKAFSTTDNSGSVDLEGLAQDVADNTVAIAENASDISDLQGGLKVLVTAFLNTGASGLNPVVSGMNVASVARIATGRYRVTHSATVTNIGVSSMSFESTGGTNFNTTLERRGTTETDIYTRGYSAGTPIDIDSARIDFALIER